MAELVRRYQDFLPESLSTELATAAFPPEVRPLLGESDQEVSPAKQPKSRHKIRPLPPQRKDSVSDFEHSYAANVAPRYLTHRRHLGKTSQGSRIPGPQTSSIDSRESSRRTSPDKRAATQRHGTEATLRGGRTSPTPPKPGAMALAAHSKGGKSRLIGRNPPKERLQVQRSASASGSKTMLRRTSNVGPVGKVSNIARHFERIYKDNEKANRRYAVIRGRRARPVASARATVEIFDSVREAIKDESETSDSSSEADDEDEGEDQRGEAASSKKHSPAESSLAESIQDNPRDSSSTVIPTITDLTALTAEPPAIDNKPSGTVADSTNKETASTAHLSMPSSPVLVNTLYKTPCETPPTSDMETNSTGAERSSTIMKTLQGLWPHHLAVTRNNFDIDGEDLMADPEHIFRDSSMVVRTDEPTSIIALALK